MKLTRRRLSIVLIITLTFLAAQEKRISGQLISQKDNKPICGVIVAPYGLEKVWA